MAAEELLLILAHVDKEKAQRIFLNSEVVTRELRALLTNLNELRVTVLELNRVSMNSPRQPSADPKAIFEALTRRLSDFRANNSTEMSDRLKALISTIDQDHQRLRATRLQGLGGAIKMCSAVFAR